MKRTIVFCDKCGTQMSHIDADGEAVVHGYQLNPASTVNHLPELRLVKNEINSTGSTSRAGFLNGRDFCSDFCMQKALSVFVGDAGVGNLGAPPAPKVT